MQWSCPHCGVTLAVPYDTLGTGWSFSRCYKCGGFALIRRAEVNIIKVDKAPPGEKVILPEAGTDPSAGLMNEEATQKFAKHANKIKGDKPTIRSVRPLTPPPLPKILQKFDEVEQLNLQSEYLRESPSETPAPTERRKRTLPFGIVMGILIAVSSGIYLFIQGQSAFQKVKNTASESHLNDGQKVTSSAPETRPPAQDPESTIPSTSLNTTNIANHSPREVNNAPPSQANLVATQKLLHPIIADRVQESAMAPLKPAHSAFNPSKTTMQVQTRLKRVSLHGGPGMQFPVIGIADPDIRYVVADWKDRWFRIALNSNEGSSDAGWIRNDLVQILPSTFMGNTTPNINPLRQ